jgi:hypothetical protein
VTLDAGIDHPCYTNRYYYNAVSDKPNVDYKMPILHCFVAAGGWGFIPAPSRFSLQ